MKQTPTLKERMRLNLELADNGIILRNPDCEDDVTLAVHPSEPFRAGGPDLSNEYRAIGQKIYDWLLDVVTEEHRGELIITNFDIDITATCKGRAMNDY